MSTPERVAVVNITDEVAAEVPAGIGRGVCTVFVPHTTAGVMVNEDEPRLLADVESMLEAVLPADGGYAHDELDGNADAHLRVMLLGSSVAVPVIDGELGLGTWQSILLVEGDGPRTRRVAVVVTEAA